ncbi:protein FAM83F-like [Brienomyrus brachyistius]|uniref:protein FAM83F-like n=1 Tax=Brienomyrus brachyistius TaxID=42636 RepID=UPI0020B2EA02|nr:protein FAM83F-like [Brienomyrus brachyistius]
MAESQLLCMDDNTVNENITENKPQFYYSEGQRAALEKLLQDGDGAFKDRLQDDGVKDFLCAREIKLIRETFREYEEDRTEKRERAGSKAERSTYWPELSDTAVPPLDIGWSDGGKYKGMTRVNVYTHPPKEREPFIKEVVRKLIQESRKLLAVVMDLLTDLHILQDLLDAASKRRVSVYIVLDARGVPHFLDMCTRLQISAMHLQNLRVRTLEGFGMALTQGKLPGSLCNKYMLVDGDKVMFGSYSFTWSSSRLNRTMITLMTGQVVDFYDQDFRELYAVSEELDLYREFHISKPSMSMSNRSTLNRRPPSVMSTTRFQVSLGDPRQINPRVPAHKYHNPKYLLAVGGSLSHLGHTNDAIKGEEQPEIKGSELVLQKFLQSNEEPEDLTPPPDETPTPLPELKKASRKTEESFTKKHRTSLKFSLKKGRQNSVANNVNSPSGSSSAVEGAITMEKRPGPQGPEQKLPSKGKARKLSQNSTSLQAATSTEDDGSKEQKQSSKRQCAVS